MDPVTLSTSLKVASSAMDLAAQSAAGKADGLYRDAVIDLLTNITKQIDKINEGVEKILEEIQNLPERYRDVRNEERDKDDWFDARTQYKLFLQRVEGLLLKPRLLESEDDLDFFRREIHNYLAKIQAVRQNTIERGLRGSISNNVIPLCTLSLCARAELEMASELDGIGYSIVMAPGIEEILGYLKSLGLGASEAPVGLERLLSKAQSEYRAKREKAFGIAREHQPDFDESSANFYVVKSQKRRYRGSEDPGRGAENPTYSTYADEYIYDEYSISADPIDFDMDTLRVVEVGRNKKATFYSQTIIGDGGQLREFGRKQFPKVRLDELAEEFKSLDFELYQILTIRALIETCEIVREQLLRYLSVERINWV